MKAAILAAIADAEARKAQVTAAHQAAQQQMIALNAHGVELEKRLLGIEGELTALTALRDADGE